MISPNGFALHDMFYSYHVDDEIGFCSLCALKAQMEESIQSPGSVLVPARFKNNLSKLSPAFIPGQQEDAHELLSCLLENLYKCTLDAKSIDGESIVEQVFGGRLKSLLTCHDCGHCSETFEPFLDISLEIDQVHDLVAALESFTKVEQLGDAENKLKCESCNGQVCKDKQLVLDTTPDVVAFQLKRFTVTLDGYIEKIDKHVAYPSQLDLQLFHTNPNKEVDSITETSALNQEAYLLFYIRQGMFPWFSSLLQEANSGVPSATKRMYPVNDHNVFAFENLVTEHQTNMKKQKGAYLSTSSESSSLDQNASRLPTGMTSVKRKCGLKRLDSPNVVLC
nr:ubiquitin carboxyl-terminal hydrolase 21-like [Lolium perenne]